MSAKLAIPQNITLLPLPPRSPELNPVETFWQFKVIPLAEGEKDQRIRESDGYRLKRINEAEGDVARFNALFAEYVKAPEVTRRRIYVETLQDILPRISSKIIIDEQSRSIPPSEDSAPPSKRAWISRHSTGDKPGSRRVSLDMAGWIFELVVQE